MADKKIAIILTADNKTKAGFSAVVKNIKALEKETTKTTKSAKGLGVGLGKLVAGFAIADLAVGVVKAGVKALRDEITESVKTASEYSLALAGLSSTAVAFGESQDQARQSAIALTQDGLITVSTAANGLKNLMAGGLGLDKAVELMGAYKDEAAFGRSATISYEQAVGNLAESFMTEGSMIGNLSGQTENYNLILKAGASQMGKTVSQLTQAERTQAKYLGTLTVASKAMGDSARVADTYAGSQSRLKTAVTNLRAALGTALLPVLAFTNDSFTDLANSLKPTPETLMKIGRVAILVAGGIKQLAIAVVSLTKAWWQFNTFRFKKSFESLKDGWSSLGDNVVKVGERMNAVTVESMSNITNFGKEAAQKLTDFADSASSKVADLAKKVSDEIKDYGRDLAKMISSFTESLDGLVFAHRNKRRALEKDIAGENKAFDKKNKEREADYKKSMTSLEKKHGEKVKSIEEDIEDELEAVKLAENQREAFQDDKYLVDINRHKDRGEDLKESLKRENSEYAFQTTELKSELAEQTADSLEQHKDRLTLLQTELAIELEIEKKHAEDFAKLKNEVAEDDITRLKRKHAEEKTERERDHNEKLAELYSQGASEKAAYDSGRGGQTQQQTQQNISDASTNNISVPELSVVNAPTIPLQNIGVGANAPSTSSGGLLSGIAGAVSDIWSGVTNFFSNLPWFAEGGVVSGSPDQAQLAVVHGQETITPAGQSVGGSVVLNVNIGTLVNSSVERRNFAEQIWLEIGEIAQSQNKSPQELLGI